MRWSRGGGEQQITGAVPDSGTAPVIGSSLDFGDSDRFFRTNFNTSFAAKTFIHIDWIGFAVYHFKNLGRTGVYAFFITITFIFVNNYFPHENTSIN
jgi:hypothetical protein